MMVVVPAGCRRMGQAVLDFAIGELACSAGIQLGEELGIGLLERVVDGTAASLLFAAVRENGLEFDRVQLATATDGTGSEDCCRRGADCSFAAVKAAVGL